MAWGAGKGRAGLCSDPLTAVLQALRSRKDLLMFVDKASSRSPGSSNPLLISGRGSTGVADAAETEDLTGEGGTVVGERVQGVGTREVP